MKNSLFTKVVFALLFCLLHTKNQTSPYVLDAFYPPLQREHHFWLRADLLCFQPKEKDIILTNRATNLATTSDVTLAPGIKPHFKWSPGYRIGFGYVLPRYKWDMAVNWSRLTSRMNQSCNIRENIGYGMFPLWSVAHDITPFDWISEAHMHWQLKLNLLDFDFGRTFSYKNQFFLRLLIGLRLSRINQTMNVNYGGGIFANGPNLAAMDSSAGYDTIFMKNNFCGIGPRIGIEPQLNVVHGFRLYSSVCASMNGGSFNIVQNECYLQNARYNKNCSLKRLRGMLDATAGCMWETFCHKNRYALAFALGWEYHLFFKQLELASNQFCTIGHKRNLSLNGFAFSVRFDF